MGWLIFLGILLLIGAIPVGAQVHFDEDGLAVKIVASSLRIQIIPMKKKKEKAPKPKKVSKKKQPVQKKSPAEAPKKKGGKLTDFLPLVKVGLDFLNDFRRKLRVNHLYLKLIMAGGDPCDLAINYGRAWDALGNLLPMLERVFVIKKRDLEVECDFEASSTRVFANLDITITIGRLLSLATVYGFRMLITFLQIKKKRKGGASA